jgi:L-threonylcarbamoyladenylate synthase
VESRRVAEILATHTPELFAAAVKEAATWLRRGELVGLPTETVYGLAADAWNPHAVARIFEAKGRPSHNPIIVHVASLEMARDCASQWPAVADRLARAFWPGPLTLVVPRAPRIPDLVTAGGPTVGVRWPSHPFIQAVIKACGFPLAAPSANVSNRTSPTTAEHVRRALSDQLRLIVDGGPAQVGIESTVLDVSVRPAQVLRPGMIHEEALRAVIGEVHQPHTGPAPAKVKSPGLLPRHYSPKARLVVWSWPDEASLVQQCRRAGIGMRRVHVIAHTRIPAGRGWGSVRVVPHDPPAFARALYGAWHECDQAGAQLIVMEAVPDSVEWRGIADRLRRAES